MPTRPLSDFLPLVLPHATDCPRPVAEQYLRLAAIEWCERTRCWRHIETTTLAANGQAIVAPDYATIFEIETAEFIDGNDNAVPLTPTQFSSIGPTDAATANAGAPVYITQVSPNTISVIPFAAGDVKLSLFLKPRSGTEYGTNPADPLQDRFNVVPEHIFIQNAEAIAEGALARLLAIKGAAWNDPNLAAFYFQRFEAACNRAFRSEVRGQQRAPARARAYFM